MNDLKMPLVSIITPSFNQAAFIEETIESVRMQDYPYIEHIVVDGGSTDGTQEILKKYSVSGDRFRYISEPDRGQSDAINKGLKMAKGEIIGWLNSDDTYFPGAVSKAVNALKEHREWAMVYGNAYYIDENSKNMHSYLVQPYDRQALFQFCIICQPAAFVRKNIFETVGGVDETLDFCMDYDLWMRISKDYSIGYIPDYLANSRLHSACKSVVHIVDKGFPEIIKSSIKHYGTVANDWLCNYLEHHSKKGFFWYVNLFKKYEILGTSPKVSDMNRYSDLWVPPNFRISIQSGLQNPPVILLIKGRNHILDKMSATVSINNNDLQNYTIPKGEFVIEIPIHSNVPNTVVEIVSNKHVVPSKLGISSDSRSLSFLVDQVIPLSAEEYKFYKEFQKGPSYASAWIQKNRNPIPVL
ncbi:glycosyltransferase family 2 protein [Peribacillus butanolivorans]|uniref:glycosyltransferase family 2 protein n=1 Tax=Peribacillus butanolivorans TaxID=421767 RepID=UPI00363FE293